MRATSEGLVLTLYEGIPFVLWDAFWLATTHNTTEHKEAFLHLYHLQTDEVIVDDDPLLVVLAVEGFELWWAAIALHLLNPEAACLDGCRESKLPWQD